MAPLYPGSRSSGSSSVFSGVFTAKEANEVGDKGSGDSIIFSGVFIAKEADEVGVKGSGDSIIVDVQTHSEA
jgi:hypothetical protein